MNFATSMCVRDSHQILFDLLLKICEMSVHSSNDLLTSSQSNIELERAGESFKSCDIHQHKASTNNARIRYVAVNDLWSKQNNTPSAFMEAIMFSTEFVLITSLKRSLSLSFLSLRTRRRHSFVVAIWVIRFRELRSSDQRSCSCTENNEKRDYKQTWKWFHTL